MFMDADQMVEQKNSHDSFDNPQQEHTKPLLYLILQNNEDAEEWKREPNIGSPFLQSAVVETKGARLQRYYNCSCLLSENHF